MVHSRPPKMLNDIKIPSGSVNRPCASITETFAYVRTEHLCLLILHTTLGSRTPTSTDDERLQKFAESPVRKCNYRGKREELRSVGARRAYERACFRLATMTVRTVDASRRFICPSVTRVSRAVARDWAVPIISSAGLY